MFQFYQQFININKHPFTLKTESLLNEIEKLKRAVARKAVLNCTACTAVHSCDWLYKAV